MLRYALPFPVLPGHSDAQVKEMAEYFRAHPDEFKKSREAQGVTLERVYLMKTPMGAFVIAYAEASKSATDVVKGYMESSLDIDRRFIEFIGRVHGFTPEAAAGMPPPETIGAWTDPAVTTRKKGLAFVAPGIPGKEDDGRALVKEAFVAKHDEMTASRRALKQNVEVVTLVQSPMGPVVAVYVEGDDPVKGNAGFAASQSTFDRWFKDELKKVIPPAVDFDKPLPPIEEIFDSVGLLAAV